MIEEIFTKKNLIYTFKAFLSLTLAFFIVMSLGLDKPMWAMIVALFLALRPEAGFIIEKGILAILVNSTGIVVAFIIISFFLPYPVLAITSLFIFIAITMYFSANMSHPNFVYGLTLANLTCTIMVLYAIANPLATTEQSIFHTGFSRISEIIIGCLSAFFVNYYIFPVKVKDTLKNHVERSFNLTIDYAKLIFSIDHLDDDPKYNKQVENIINSLILLDNDLTANKYENINSNNYYNFSDKVIKLIQTAHLIRKHIVKNKSNNLIKTKLEKISTELESCCSNNTKISLTSNNILVRNLVNKFNSMIESYNQINSTKILESSNKTYFQFKNYNNNIVGSINIFRTIFLLLFLSLLWLNTQTSSSSLILMIVAPSAFSQLLLPTLNTDQVIKKMITGMIISVPISIFIVLNLLAQVVGYFELFMLVLIVTLFLPVITLTIPRFQPYSLGFIVGWICMIQPSNHMNFNIPHLLSSGLSAFFGCFILWLAFKVCPQGPYAITRKLAVKSIIKDRKKLRNREISKNQYNAYIVKKILCIYKNRKNDISSERDIDFALKSLTKSI
ncbi:FUSC family protein [Francisella sp. SYW-9]|uniref:FUSC family protein n=1 Tax=Francisella sp. SYW-9 TaxID=2610888 RepID=UPI00123DE7AA|nr:FUSC family protein [Francisella sp. SYW-9]